jgi:hypothetical protein
VIEDDTRAAVVAALVDEARTMLADMSEERDLPTHLQAARFALNVAVSHLEIHRRMSIVPEPA